MVMAASVPPFWATKKKIVSLSRVVVRVNPVPGPAAWVSTPSGGM
jgi:hypothetical protein